MRRTGRVFASKWVHALTTFGVAQGLSMLSALLRVPLAIAAIGVVQFGLLSLLAAALPWLGLLATSTRTCLRILAAERGDQTFESGRALEHLFGCMQPARIFGRMCLVGSALCLCASLLVVPLSRVAHEGSVVIGLSACLLATGTVARGSAQLGIWEGRGHLTRVHAFTALSAIFGLGLTAVGAALDAPFLIFVIAFLLPVYGPAWIAAVAAWSSPSDRLMSLRSLAIRRRHTDVVAGRHLSWKLARTTGVQQLQNGVDAFLIGAALGPLAVSQYSVVQRIFMALAAAPTAIQPLFVRHFAALRRSATPAILRRRQLVMSAGLASATGLVAAILAHLGQSIVSILTNGAMSVPSPLLWAIGAQVTIFAWQVPVLAALAGPKGTSLLARWMPIVAATNLGLSILFAPVAVWAPTMVSVAISIAAHAVLFVWATGHKSVFEGAHLNG